MRVRVRVPRQGPAEIRACACMLASSGFLETAGRAEVALGRCVQNTAGPAMSHAAPPGVFRGASKVCEHCQPLRHETNVLVLARLNVLGRLADINLLLALSSILYFAVSVVLLIVTVCQMNATDGVHIVDSEAFHMIDFGSNFVFSITEVLTLVYSPERRFTAPILLRILMFFSVNSTFVGALLIALNRSAFEVLAHNIDYINDFTVATVDSILVSTVVRSPASHPGQLMSPRRSKGPCDGYGKQIAMVATLVPVSMSFAQVLVYNFFGVDFRGHLLGERPAHVLEFIFDGVGAVINFWFCLDSKMLAEELTRQIMIAPDELVVVIDPESKTSVHTADECGRSPHPRPAVPPPWFGNQQQSFSSHAHDHSCAHVHDHAQHAHDHQNSGGECEHGDCCEHDHGFLPPRMKPPPKGASPLTQLLLPNDMSSAAQSNGHGTS